MKRSGRGEARIHGCAGALMRVAQTASAHSHAGSRRVQAAGAEALYSSLDSFK